MFTSAINYLAGAASSVAGGSVPSAPSIPGDTSGISQDDPLVKYFSVLQHLFNPDVCISAGSDNKYFYTLFGILFGQDFFVIHLVSAV